MACPENFILGHPVWLVYDISGQSEKSMKFAAEFYKNSVEIPSEAVDKICQAASRASVYVVMGMSEKSPIRQAPPSTRSFLLTALAKSSESIKNCIPR